MPTSGANALDAVMCGKADEAKKTLSAFDHWDLEDLTTALKDLSHYIELAHEELEKKEEREQIIQGARKLLEL